MSFVARKKMPIKSNMMTDNTREIAGTSKTSQKRYRNSNKNSVLSKKTS